MSNIFQLNREQLKALLAQCAIHAPSFAEAQAVAERVITELENSDTITNRLVRGMAQPEPIVAAFLAGTAKPETHDDFMLLANEALRQMDIINHHLRLINTPKHEPADAVSDVPSERVNMPDPENDGARIIGFRIREGDAAWGKYGLSEPLAWLEDFTARHARGVQADAVSDEDAESLIECVYGRTVVHDNCGGKIARFPDATPVGTKVFTARHARGVPDVGLSSLVNLWRQREVSDESKTEFDKGCEQTYNECADALEAFAVSRSLGVPDGINLETIREVISDLREWGKDGNCQLLARAEWLESAIPSAAAQPTKEADQ